MTRAEPLEHAAPASLRNSNSAANATSTSASNVAGSIIFESVGINIVNRNYNTVGIGSGNDVDIFV